MGPIYSRDSADTNVQWQPTLQETNASTALYLTACNAHQPPTVHPATLRQGLLFPTTPATSTVLWAHTAIPYSVNAATAPLDACPALIPPSALPVSAVTI